MLLLRRFRKRRLRTKQKHYAIVASIWIYTVGWFALNYYIWFNLDWSIGYKILAEFLLAMFVPEVEDLFTSYDKYVKEHEAKV